MKTQGLWRGGGETTVPKIFENAGLLFYANNGTSIPVLATCGFKDLTVLLEEKGVALVTRATQLLRCSMQKLWKKKLAGKRRGGEGDGTSTIESLSLSMTPLERLRRSREEGRGIKASETDPIKNAVDEWLNQDFSPEGELWKQRHRMRRDCNDIDYFFSD